MRIDRLLNLRNQHDEERGAVELEAAFAIALLMLLTLGIIQIAVYLYARNIVMSSAHEAARAVIEVGRGEAEATEIARRVMQASARSIIGEPHIDVRVERDGETVVARVAVAARLEAPGPIPLPLPITTSATAAAQGAPR